MSTDDKHEILQKLDRINHRLTMIGSLVFGGFGVWLLEKIEDIAREQWS